MFIGLDLGTSGLKAILVDSEGSIVASADASMRTRNPAKGWSEQDPQEWVDACDKVMKSLGSRCEPHLKAVKAIGISGHMHGATLIDAAGEVLRPCILWNDTRSSAEAAALDAIPEMREITANIVFPGFTAPKLAWVRQHEPHTWEKVAKVLLPKDFLRYWLTGEYISDMSDSAGTSWMDVKKRDWSERALEVTGMRRDQMPELVEGSDVGGEVRTELRQRWGLSENVVVAGGGGDNAAAACGVGAISEGAGFVSLGTSGVLLAARDSFAPAPDTAVHTFCHAVPDRWYQMGVILSATDSLNWLSRTLGQSAGDLAGLLPDQISGPSSLTFLPYLSGERTPHNSATVRGSLVGLDVATEPVDMVQSVMEGVGFALRDSLEALRATGAELSDVLAVGGGTRSRFWLRSLATILNIPLQIPAGGEFGAALGAARLAMCAGSGATVEDVMTRPEISETVEPDADLVRAYDDHFQKYRALYPALKAHFA